ncbi:MAG: hypothetical protein NTX65_05140 [Ignavibacteriales bacterium]|nr:hypothetical protein [Ignavibacteriales bacterium]
MLSLEDVRKLLPDEDKNLSDDEVKQIRDEFRLLAGIIYEQWQEEHQKERKEDNNHS